MGYQTKTYSDPHFYSVYFAPRGRQRMLSLGQLLAQQHLSPDDRLIGIIGEAGSGKSILVKGMFPGLELTSDDQGVNIRPLPILSADSSGFSTAHTFHLDVRFEMAFTPLKVLAQAVENAVLHGKRVVVEHFDLLYPEMKMNAELLIGIGEEIILTRPTIFGPEPVEIVNIVGKSQIYRKMAHTAENITERFLAEYGDFSYAHADVRHGFVLVFSEKPPIDLEELERKVLDYIEKNVPVSYLDEGHILFGSDVHPCTGPRIHVRSTGEIVNFSLNHEYLYDPIQHSYLLIGTIGEEGSSISDRNKLQLL